MAFEDFFRGNGMLGIGAMAGGRTAAPQAPRLQQNDPWGYMGQNAAKYGDPFQVLLSQAGQGGVFDPTGNQALLGALRSDAQRQSLGRTRSAMEFARRNNLDPSAQGMAGLMAMLGGQSDLADALLSARTQSGLQNQSMYQNLFGGAANNLWDWGMAQHQGEVQKGVNKANKPKGGMGGMLGQIGGMALGSVIPGVGTAIGGALGGMLGGGGGGGVSVTNAGMMPGTPFYPPTMR